jgi:polar amino acid transport system substrate-binding protein
MLGTQLDYVYSVPLMAACANQQITRQDLRDFGSGLHLLHTQRLDAIIEMPRQLPAGQAAGRATADQPWVIERYQMHCTYSSKLPVSSKQLDQVLYTLRDQGVISRLLGDI